MTQQSNELAKYDFYHSLQALAEELSNQPLKSELEKNDLADGALYLPISAVEAKLDFWFPLAWQTDNFSWQVISNEIACSIQLHVWNPYFQQWITRTGVGASQIQFKKGSDITDVSNKIKNTISKDLPSAKAEALKNAAKSLGKTFGRDLNRNSDNQTASAMELPEYRTMLTNCTSDKELVDTFKQMPKTVQGSKDIQSVFRQVRLKLKYEANKQEENQKGSNHE